MGIDQGEKSPAALKKRYLKKKKKLNGNKRMTEIQSSSWYDNKWILIPITLSYHKTRIPFRGID